MKAIIICHIWSKGRHFPRARIICMEIQLVVQYTDVTSLLRFLTNYVHGTKCLPGINYKQASN